MDPEVYSKTCNFFLNSASRKGDSVLYYFRVLCHFVVKFYYL